MTQADITLKGELHVSRADLNESIELIEDGVDHLILEGSEHKAEYPKRHFWFRLLMRFVIHFFFNRLYTDSTALENAAGSQDATITKTRKSNAQLIVNASRGDIVTAFLVFLLCCATGLIVAFVKTTPMGFLAGLAMFTLGLFLPPALLRIEESHRKTDNRDKLIAEKIVAASETGGRIVAVVGENHREDIAKHLPERINVNHYPPVHHWYHPWILLTYAKAISVILVLYGVVFLSVYSGLTLVIGLL